jgi:hypothetical protein
MLAVDATSEVPELEHEQVELLWRKRIDGGVHSPVNAS